MCDGLGVRVVLWVSGCSHKCIGCHNQCSWNEFNGEEFTEETFEELTELLDKPYIKGLTFSGGDPLYQSNRSAITKIAEKVKQLFPAKDIWCYTGYLYEEVKDLPVMYYIDYLVDGKFELEKRDTTIAFRGSSNQRIIHIPTKNIYDGGVTYGL